MDYLNETLWVGKLGHAGIVLAWVSAVFIPVFYWQIHGQKSSQETRNWQIWARITFIIHLISNLLVFACLLHILYYHLFEYYYAYQHSSKNLSLKFILSSLWEGQEGSFLLWALWNTILAGIFILTEKHWESRVMPIIGLMQIFLYTMLLGIWIGEIHIGSNPFVLLRNQLDAPLFEQSDYLTKLADGRGLNALLQNYWMIIHPPILFLGFSLCLFPFATIIGALCSKEYITWTKVTLRWGLLATGVLGLGIMMGAAWAYESLTFGGYWAWDPVENASLVPWLLLLAAIHLNLLCIKNTKHLRLCILLYIFALLSVLYSTYLTRSGILGNTSVHSFTDLGMNNLLLIFLGVFTLGSLGIYFIRRSYLPKQHQYGQVELYLFLGTLVLILSALLISLQTSLPVINKIFHSQFAPPKDIEYSFNQHQVFSIWGICLFSSLAILILYARQQKINNYYKKLALIGVISLGLSILIYCLSPVFYDKYGVVFAWAIIIAYVLSFFMLCTNVILLAIIFLYNKGKLLKQGGMIAHIGFAILIIGILISSTGKKVLSWNVDNFSPLNMQDEEKPFENLTLIKGIPVRMGNYQVSYIADSSADLEGKIYYLINFQHQLDSDLSFTLKPNIIRNTKGMEGVSPNPDAKHRWNGDIFSYLTFLSEPDSLGKNMVEYNGNISSGKTITIKAKSNSNSQIKIQLLKDPNEQNIKLILIDSDGNSYNKTILLPENKQIGKADFWGRIRDNRREYYQIQLKKHTQEIYNIHVNYTEKQTDFITLKVYEFPFIMLVWIGVIIMSLGFFSSAYARYKYRQ